MDFLYVQESLYLGIVVILLAFFFPSNLLIRKKEKKKSSIICIREKLHRTILIWLSRLSITHLQTLFYIFFQPLSVKVWETNNIKQYSVPIIVDWYPRYPFALPAILVFPFCWNINFINIYLTILQIHLTSSTLETTLFNFCLSFFSLVCFSLLTSSLLFSWFLIHVVSFVSSSQQRNGTNLI